MPYWIPIKKVALHHPFIVYPLTLLLAGCSPAEPVSSSGQLHKNKRSLFINHQLFLSTLPPFNMTADWMSTLYPEVSLDSILPIYTDNITDPKEPDYEIGLRGQLDISIYRISH